jgi:monovalent cation:H+ antiporter, CPA1 family
MTPSTLALCLVCVLWVTRLEARLASRALPASVLLVALGFLCSALLPAGLPNRDLLIVAVLAPLLYEGARAVDVDALRRDRGPIVTLALLGTLLSSVWIGGVLIGLCDWPWRTTVPFALLIAATDPVAVIATFRAAGLGGRLWTLVEAESLLNDAVAACALTLAQRVLETAGRPSVVELLAVVAREVGLAVLLGGLAGAAVIRVLRLRTTARVRGVIEIAVAMAVAAVALRWHASAVLAVVVTGLSVAATRPAEPLDPHHPLHTVGHYANTVVFLLIGWLAGPALRPHGGAIAVASLVVLGARAAAIYPLAALFRRSRAALPLAYQHVLVAGSLRGALAFTLVLPAATGATVGAPMALTLGVVAVSVIAQGLAIRPLLRRWELIAR